MKLSWYWHRLRAMSASEMALRARKKLREAADAGREQDWSCIKLEASGAYPKLPPREEAPPLLREALTHDAERIRSGRWRAFGHLELRVDDPPKWQKDYLSGSDLFTADSAFSLDHRRLPSGADIKLIWELSRWHHLTRLAMASWLLDDERAGEKVVLWLEDWVKHNRAFRGWNWTSALESGLRLIQFAWMDALLSPNAERWSFEAELDRLRHEILPANAWFTWRHRSFGSSANNHLIGELVGLITAAVRWPALERWAAPVAELQRLWEREVLAQFATDGGNREQALNYHLFSLELCLHARSALLASGRTIPPAVESRLEAAIGFYAEVQTDGEPWDYGDSDDGFVLPLFLSELTYRREWRKEAESGKRKAESENGGGPIAYWLGSQIASQTSCPTPLGPKFRWYPESGMALCESEDWRLRWDLSPLGYLKTAAHGHLDALHLSIWFKGVAFVIDPGTGAYFGDAQLRAWLASRAAHNAPCPEGPEWPRRAGPFLWEQQHPQPEVANDGKDVTARLALKTGEISRKIALERGGLEVRVEDWYQQHSGAAGPFTVTWQFAPGTAMERTAERIFVIKRGGTSISMEVSKEWEDVVLSPPSPLTPHTSHLLGMVSPAFRATAWAPFVKLVARPSSGESCVFRTTFVASAAS